jgi:DNA-binding transcriptional LysR family regulator
MDIDTLDLRKLRAFYLVARHGSLSRAAARLNITLSAVSSSIRRLEEQLGIQLFRRMPNRLILTPSGEQFAETVEAIFDGIEKVIENSSLEGAPVRRVSVAISGDLAWYFVPKISDFLKLYPDTELSVYIKSSLDALQLVERGEADLGIGRFSKVPRMLEMQPILQSSISLACLPDHPLARRKMPQLKDVVGYKLVTLASGQSSRAMIDDAFTKAGVVPGSYIEAGNCRTVCEFVEAGVGIGLMHTFCSRRAASAKLHFWDFSRYFVTGTFSVVYQKGGSRPALFKKLRDALLVSAP